MLFTSFTSFISLTGEEVHIIELLETVPVGSTEGAITHGEVFWEFFSSFTQPKSNFYILFNFGFIIYYISHTVERLIIVGALLCEFLEVP